MKRIKLLSTLILTALIVFSSCTRDEEPSSLELDDELSTNFNEISGNQDASFFILPDSDDYNSIPQDPNNPITDANLN